MIFAAFAASNQPGRAAAPLHGVCGDGTHGATLVAQVPAIPADAVFSNVVIYRTSAVGDTYVRSLRAMTNLQPVRTVQDATALQQTENTMMNAMRVVFQNGRFVKPDERGTIVCGDLPAGMYDIVVTATRMGGFGPSSSAPVRYFFAHVNVPDLHGRRYIIRSPALTPV